MTVEQAMPEVNAMQEDAAREKIPAPENAMEAEAAREPLKPVEHTATAAPEHVAAKPAIELPKPSVPLVVHPDTFKKAEENLAAYVGSKMNRELTEGLTLTLSNHLSAKHDGAEVGTDLKLSFTSALVEPNFAEMSRELMAALQLHPAIAASLSPSNALTIDRGHKEPALHLHLPNLTAEGYASLIQTLAAETPVVAHHAPAVHADAHVCTAACDHAHADVTAETPMADAAITAATDHPALDAEVAAQEDASAVVTPPKEAPVHKLEPEMNEASAQVETPVIQMGPVAKETEHQISA